MSATHERRANGFLYSDDPARIDMDAVHGFLSTCYWSPGIPRETLTRAMANSLVFGAYEEGTGRQAAFARVVTDRATYAYLCDVFVLESHRGRGLSKELMAHILAHPDLQGLRRFALLTRDAQGLYERFGFKVHTGKPTTYMQVVNTEIYRKRSSKAADQQSSRSEPHPRSTLP